MTCACVICSSNSSTIINQSSIINGQELKNHQRKYKMRAKTKKLIENVPLKNPTTELINDSTKCYCLTIKSSSVQTQTGVDGDDDDDLELLRTRTDNHIESTNAIQYVSNDIIRESRLHPTDPQETSRTNCRANKLCNGDTNSLQYLQFEPDTSPVPTALNKTSKHVHNSILSNLVPGWHRWKQFCTHTNSDSDEPCKIRRKSKPSKFRMNSPGGIWKLILTSLLLSLFYGPIQFNNLVEGAGTSELPVGLSGSTEKCDREGEVFPLPGLLHDPCYTCLCRNGEVQCEKQTCPNLQGCFLIVLGQKEGCCDVCKGCTIGNVTIPNGKELLLDDCTMQTCLAGIITKSSIQCHVPCSHPVPPSHNTAGQDPSSCCPSCSSCYVNGKVYQNGQEAILNGDPCTRCKCNNGSLTCLKKACPVLACPPSSTYLPKGDCCPKCNGTRTRYIPRTVCILGDKVYPSKTNFRLDTCTNCTCSGTTAICDRISCPPLLDCDLKNQVMTQGSCCPTCSIQSPSSNKNEVQLHGGNHQATGDGNDNDEETEEEILAKSKCTWKERIFNNGDKWDVNSCQSCICDWGKIRCTEQLCPKDINCPWGYQLKNKPGQCCPECIGEEGVCTVFGDPHYRSFDGRIFNFQGACKYLLTSDCKGKSFSVRVRNDARASSTFSWTRTVTLKTKEGRLTLGQKMRIKFNGKRIALPFSSGALKVTGDGGYSAIVDTGVGLKLLWDGDSYLEVSVQHRLHGRLCGLCGNFNGNRTDDFVTKRGGPVNHPSLFGQSWRVGGKKACSRPEEVKGPEPLCRKNWLVREKAEKLCNALKSHIFSACAKVVSPDRFFKACKVDMCECPPDRKCHCDALMAYSRACKRAGVEINNWREATRCSHKKNWKP